jgi:alternate signal-mediated exported protein
MNKMTKGALATGLGVALLVGGGGTLAVWNANAGADAGTVKSGNLNITADPGVWTNAISKEGESIDISTYKMVPGDMLTFTQPVTVDLVGDLMQATLTLTDPNDISAHLEVSDITLTDKNGKEFTETALDPADSGKYTAKVTVELPDTVEGRDYVNETHQLETIGFTLTQDATDTVAD